MQSLADGLPPEVAQQIHPDWWKNEAKYWTQRDTLLAQYRDKWVAFANGAVVASGSSPVEVFHEAQESGQHPYVACVGREHEPCRMRRAVSRTMQPTLASHCRWSPWNSEHSLLTPVWSWIA